MILTHLVLFGFFPGAGGAIAPVTVESNSGGWLSDEQVAALRRLAKRTQNARKPDWERAREREAEALSELRQAYDRAQGIEATPDRIEAVTEAVAAFAGQDVRADRLPARIDWTALLASAQAVARLAQALADLRQDDNDALEAILMAAAL